MIPPPEDETRLKCASPRLFNHTMFRIFPTCLKSRDEVIYAAGKCQYLHVVSLKSQLNCKYLNLSASYIWSLPTSEPPTFRNQLTKGTAQCINLKVMWTSFLLYLPSCSLFSLSFSPTSPPPPPPRPTFHVLCSWPFPFWSMYLMS